jgi:hypothetical protein
MFLSKRTAAGLVAAALLAAPAALADVVDDQVAAGALDWIERPEWKAEVVAYAKAGTPTVVVASPECAATWRPHHDQLGTDEHGYPICVTAVALPEAVAADVATMEKSRFANESDYDQRVTKLYVFKHDGDLSRYQSTASLEALALAVGIPERLIGGFRFHAVLPTDKDAFYTLESLYVGSDFADSTSLSTYATGLLGASAVLAVTFGPDEVELYPGGGFTTDFAFYITKDYVIYAKREGWNS